MLSPTDKNLVLSAEGNGPLPPKAAIFGRSWAMREVEEMVGKVAGTNVPVLLQGESGTGKEVIARLIHHVSPWRSELFVKVNCPAIPGTLLESELFGYERGAFTGAYVSKPGRVELADRGTLFMDEIGELELGLQAKLLQLLQDGQFARLGSQEDRRVEVRLICATNRRLEREIEAGLFRRDLYFRINVVSMELPPLRDRREDIPDLVQYFLNVYSTMFRHAIKAPSAPFMDRLRGYHWPGNIRQLENVVKRYVIFGDEECLTSDLVESAPEHVGTELPADGSVSLKDLTGRAVRDLERKIILKTLQAHCWNRRKTARTLRISYRTLLYKIRGAGLVSAKPKRSSRRHSNISSPLGYQHESEMLQERSVGC